MISIETIAATLYDDNLRQINQNNFDRALRHGYSHVDMVQNPFAAAEEHIQKMFLSYAAAALKAIKVCECP